MTDLERVTAALADQYAIERELGQGGMATVYLAEDLKHHRQVAIKVMRPELAAAMGSERFLREISIAAQLQHPHILMLIDSGEADGILYYVMPYVEGESLADRVERETQLPIDEALLIGREVASALAYAHSHGVIHRDIKPDNIMLTGGHAVVMDFGIGRAVSEAGGEKLTQTGMSVGTPAYMSPEQGAGEANIDGRTDIYALGSVIYELLVGEAPYTGPTAQAIIAKRYADPVPSARRLRDTIPPNVDSAIQKAMAKIPADRFSTAEQLAVALTTATGSGEIVSVPVPSGSVRAPMVRRVMRARGIAAAAALVVALVVFVVMPLVKGSDVGVAATDKVTLAILPFQNLGDPDDEYFAEGMTEELSNRLARLSGLSVIGPASAGRFSISDMGEGAVGDALHVEYLLAGTIRWAKEADGSIRVQVTPRLVKVSDESRVWGEPFEAEFLDVFELQANLAERVVQALDVTLLGSEARAIRAAPTDNPAAYQAYVLGRYYQTRSDGPRAIEHYETAISLDPEFALAYAGLADGYHYALQSGPGGVNLGGMLRQKYENWAKAEQAARRALALDSTLGAAHVSLAFVQMFRELNWSAAEAGYLRGLALDPDYAQGHSRYGMLLLATGRVDAALEAVRRAADLDPLAPHYQSGLASVLSAVGRFDEALAATDSILALDSLYTRAYLIKGLIHLKLRDFDAAALNAARGGLPPDLVELWHTAVVGPGGSEALVEYLDRNEALVERIPSTIAILLASVGEYDRAIEALYRAYGDRVFDTLLHVKTLTVYDPLRDHPKFISLQQQMGLE